MLAPEQTASGQSEVCVSRHKGRVASTKLERDRCQCLSRLFRDDRSDHGVTRVEDLVPLLIQQRGGLILASVSDSEAGRVKFLDELLQHHRGCRADLAGFQHGGAASSDGTDDRADAELDGEVPAADDEDGAERLLADNGAHELIRQWHVRGGLVLRPLLEVLGDEDDVVLAPLDLRNLGLVDRLADIDLQCFDDVGGEVHEPPVELAQLLDTPCDGARLLRGVGEAHAGGDRGEGLDGGVLERVQFNGCLSLRRHGDGLLSASSCV